MDPVLYMIDLLKQDKTPAEARQHAMHRFGLTEATLLELLGHEYDALAARKQSVYVLLSA